MAKNNQVIIYEGSEGQPRIEVTFGNDTVWLNQDQMSHLFGRDQSVISRHIKNVYYEGELEEKSTMQNMHTAISDKPVALYNLDVIISVGYRIKSQRGIQFRIWATKILKEYLIKGFAMDDERLKKLGGGGYWKELLSRIRDIRSSEKVFYRQILDIYATSIDYDSKAQVSKDFFKKVQNKVHYAVHGNTAAEVIYNRADAEKEFMGLMTFTGSKPQLKDVKIAKNYLGEKELRALGQIVSGYLDFAERQVEREVPMKMEDWAKHLDAILASTGEELLLDAGKISHMQAVKKATGEYKKYQQKTLSDVEHAYLESIKGLEKKVVKKLKD